MLQNPLEAKEKSYLMPYGSCKKKYVCCFKSTYILKVSRNQFNILTPWKSKTDNTSFMPFIKICRNPYLENTSFSAGSKIQLYENAISSEQELTPIIDLTEYSSPFHFHLSRIKPYYLKCKHYDIDFIYADISWAHQ